MEGPAHHLLRAIALFDGNQTKFAKEIGEIPQTVNRWIARGRVPAEHCPDIELATSGRVTCEQLRPDVKWRVLRGASGLACTCRPAAANDERHAQAA